MKADTMTKDHEHKHKQDLKWRDSSAWGGALVMLYVMLAALPLALAYKSQVRM